MQLQISGMDDGIAIMFSRVSEVGLVVRWAKPACQSGGKQGLSLARLIKDGREISKSTDDSRR